MNDKNYGNEIPDVSSEMLQRAIVQRWNNYKHGDNFNPDTVTYIIFEDLYRLNEYNLNFMNQTYETLIKLNRYAKNFSMVKHLEIKRAEYNKYFTGIYGGSENKQSKYTT